MWSLDWREWHQTPEIESDKDKTQAQERDQEDGLER